MASKSRHAARTQVWPALAAGRAPLSPGTAPAAERQAVRRPLGQLCLAFALFSILTVQPAAKAADEIASDCSCLPKSDFARAMKTCDFVAVVRILGAKEIRVSAFSAGAKNTTAKIMKEAKDFFRRETSRDPDYLPPEGFEYLEVEVETLEPIKGAAVTTHTVIYRWPGLRGCRFPTVGDVLVAFSTIIKPGRQTPYPFKSGDVIVSHWCLGTREELLPKVRELRSLR